jgi:hypothetical protein
MKLPNLETFSNIKTKIKGMKKVHVLNTVIGVLSCVTLVLFLSFMHRIFLEPSVDPYVNMTETNKPEEIIQISVLNACGINGLAGKTREYLRRRGYDVVEIGNYPEVLDQSIICDRTGDFTSAEKVAFAMGIQDSCIITEPDSTLFIRASIIIGNDFHELKPFN